jgi:hemoglobin-like flavoprotein
MNPERSKRIQMSYAAIAPHARGMVEDFYGRLFVAAPALRGLFPTDLSKLTAHFMAALATVARNADQMDVLEESLMELGAAHVRYGAEPAHYDVVKKLLLESLAAAAGKAGIPWGKDVADDWDIALSMVCEAMLKGAMRGIQTKVDTRVGKRA